MLPLICRPDQYLEMLGVEFGEDDLTRLEQGCLDNYIPVTILNGKCWHATINIQQIWKEQNATV